MAYPQTPTTVAMEVMFLTTLLPNNTDRKEGTELKDEHC